MLEDLREQIIQEDEELALEEERRRSRRLLNILAPWQRLVLAVLIFLDVVICGCMVLVMAGRVHLPF